jgi:hypothetical protein
MPWSEKHVPWLVDTNSPLQTTCGKSAAVWEFRHTKDPTILAAWAKHFRNHYCLDSEIDALRNGTGLSRKAYLETIKFPDHHAAPGPSIRAGDFAEILLADYLEYVLKFWVPRTRYGDKTVRNESTKGCDLIGFKFFNPARESPNDQLAIFESKAQLSTSKTDPRLQDAVDDSAKDHIRRGESLNAIKQRLLHKESFEEVRKVERFQNPVDHPYRTAYGAAAVFSTSAYSADTERQTDCRQHPHHDGLDLVIVHGDDLMTLVHELYRRAADEA